MGSDDQDYRAGRRTLIAVRQGQLRRHAWPGEGCESVFDDGTGLTHLIDVFPAAVLETLADGPADLETLSRALAMRFGEVADAEWLSLVERSVNGLAQLQLVESGAPIA